MSDWIELTEGKQFSRLLYPNPVCFLGTTSSSTTDQRHENQAKNEPAKNVMVLSWLTATNNHGKFIFSLNRHRHSAAMLSESFSSSSTTSHEGHGQHNRTPTRFTLSVPVQGMEELVLAVGSVSGRWGSKFPAQESAVDEQYEYAAAAIGNPTTCHDEAAGHGMDGSGWSPESLTRKRRKRPRFLYGIPGLEAVAVGGGLLPACDDDDHNDALFAVKGTVAHVECVVHQIVTDPLVVDEDHYLVAAAITRAFVRRSHWNVDKNLFQPQGDVPPILSFLGSQTFAHVQCDNDNAYLDSM